MGFRFRKSFKIAPGVRLNLSKSGVGISGGVKGLRASVGPRGTRMTASVPGTGISYSASLSGGRKRASSASSPVTVRIRGQKSMMLAYALWLLGCIGAHRFYLGRSASGLLMLGLFVFGIASVPPLLAVWGLWWLVDLFLIPRMSRV